MNRKKGEKKDFIENEAVLLPVTMLERARVFAATI